MKSITGGWVNGFLGMLIFSGSLPATRMAVMDFDPVFLTVARVAIAGLIAAGVLLIMNQKRPGRAEVVPLLLVALGVVIGFPLLTALALQHATVYVALLPLVTALFAVLRAGERPSPAFWFFSVLGSLLVAGFTWSSGSSSSSMAGDLSMLGAIVVCGLGYAEGAKLSGKLGGWQVIFWYRGLAQGGIAAVGQLQLLQSFFSMLLAVLLLGETLSVSMLVSSVLVIFCVFGGRRTA